LIRASSAESDGTVVFVSSRASSRCLRFVERIDGSSSIDEFVLGSCECFSPVSLSSIVAMVFVMCVFRLFPAQPLSPSPYLPNGNALSRVLPLPPRRTSQRRRPSPVPAPALAHLCPGEGGSPPSAWLGPFPSLLWLKGRRWREEEEDCFANRPLDDFKTVRKNFFQFKIAISFAF
jgi:hypothetical protein